MRFTHQEQLKKIIYNLDIHKLTLFLEFLWLQFLVMLQTIS